MTGFVYSPCGLKGGSSSISSDSASEQWYGFVPSGYASALLINDPVTIANGALTTPALTGGKITAFDAVFKGIEYTVKNPVKNRFIGGWVAGTVLADSEKTIAYTEGFQDKRMLFNVVTDSGIADRTCIGKTADLNPGAGNLLNNQSTVSLNVASIGTGTAVVIVNVIEGPGSKVGSGNPVRLLVMNAKGGNA